MTNEVSPQWPHRFPVCRFLGLVTALLCGFLLIRLWVRFAPPLEQFYFTAYLRTSLLADIPTLPSEHSNGSLFNVVFVGSRLANEQLFEHPTGPVSVRRLALKPRAFGVWLQRYIYHGRSLAAVKPHQRRHLASPADAADETAELVGDRFVLRRLDLLRVKGKLKPMAVYELLDEGRAGADLSLRVTEYEAAWELYRRQQWAEEARARQSAEREADERRRADISTCPKCDAPIPANFRHANSVYCPRCGDGRKDLPTVCGVVLGVADNAICANPTLAIRGNDRI